MKEAAQVYADRLDRQKANREALQTRRREVTQRNNTLVETAFRDIHNIAAKAGSHHGLTSWVEDDVISLLDNVDVMQRGSDCPACAFVRFALVAFLQAHARERKEKIG